MSLQQKVTETFKKQYGESPAFIVRAPGRVNLIGEHTDYNEGFVLPMAIDRASWIALRPREDGRVVVYSLDFEDEIAFELAELKRSERASETTWGDYLKGVAWVLQENDARLKGWEGILAGDVPIGSGLSSSAALELATARAFTAVAGIPWDAKEMALKAQRAENQWVGVQCGIMDQMISAVGRSDHAVLIDCRTLETESVPIPPGSTVVVLDTATRRGLANSAYNERRAQCETAARQLGVPALRDLSVAAFEAGAGQLDKTIRRRARHVVTENARTLQAADAMHEGDAATLGRLMYESHRSLRDDFEVSSEELNLMVELALEQDGCFGARMTGGGFGGCAIALVRSDAARRIAAQVADSYRARSGIDPNVYICKATNGAELV